MNYTTEYRKTLEEIEVLFSDQAAMNNNKGTKRREEVTVATHTPKGVVIRLDYYEAVSYYDSMGNFYDKAEPNKFIRTFYPKPRKEFEKSVEDYHNTTMRIIRDRGEFLRECVAGL